MPAHSGRISGAVQRKEYIDFNMYYASGFFGKVYIVMEQGKSPLKGIRDISGFRNWGVREKPLTGRELSEDDGVKIEYTFSFCNCFALKIFSFIFNLLATITPLICNKSARLQRKLHLT